jgi:hypothetical protein
VEISAPRFRQLKNNGGAFEDEFVHDIPQCDEYNTTQSPPHVVLSLLKNPQRWIKSAKDCNRRNEKTGAYWDSGAVWRLCLLCLSGESASATSKYNNIDKVHW